MKDMLIEMMEIQNELNNKFVGPDWKERELNWSRYIRVEAYELMDHYGTFKHWKAPSTNLYQARIELVDIWHFLLSQLIEITDTASISFDQVAEDISNAATQLEDMLTQHDDLNIDINDAIDDLVQNTLTAASVLDSIASVFIIQTKLGIDFDWVARHYFGKVALNRLRINYGQQEGKYIKNWGKDKIEDNVFLEKLFEEDIAPDIDVIYARLEEKYRWENADAI